MTGEQPTPPERLYAANTAAARFYADRLPTSRAAARYLTSHGIETMADPTGPWQIGYAPGRWTDLATHLQAAGFSPEEIVAAGLGFIHRGNGHLLDRFRDRLMFPITDVDNRIVGFTARDLTGRAEAKWMNTPETTIYRKRLLLYGLGQQLANPPADVGDGVGLGVGARGGLGAGVGTVGNGPIVFVVEGAADVLAIHRMAAAHAAMPEARPVFAVAPCGTSLTREQLDLLQQTLPDAHLILAFDGDDGGRRAVNRAYPIAAKWPGKVSGVRLPDEQDPADLLAAKGPNKAIRKIIDAVEPLAQLQMINTISRLFNTKRITDPARFVEDRITAYRAIAELFVDAPRAARTMAETAAEQLGLDATDVARGVVEAWHARTEISGGTDPPTVVPPPTAPPDPTFPAAHPERPTTADPGQQPVAPADRSAHSSSARAADVRATVSAAARSRTTDTTAVITRHDPSSGITVWALAHGIGPHAQTATCAQLAADIAATVTLHSTPAAGLHAARAAINAYYGGVHPSQAGDASLLVVSAHPAPETRHDVRFELGWAGDCRAYTIRAGQLAQVTIDHTVGRRHRDQAADQPPGGIADLLLTSSIRAGDISVSPLDEGPLLLCTSTLHRAVPHRRLAAELAEMSDAQATADRLTDTARQHGAHNAAVLLIHARTAPPARITTTGPAPQATVATSSTPAALARTSFAHPAAGPASAPQPRIATPPGQSNSPLPAHRR